MVRRIIHIEEEKCNGCGLCAKTCHEDAIEIIHGKAKLIKDDYCDGLGDCLPNCPTGAITFEEREAADYDEEAVMERKQQKEQSSNVMQQHTGCPGTQMRQLHHQDSASNEDTILQAEDGLQVARTMEPESRLQQWPCQIKLMSVNAPYYDGAKLLIAADCTAYAYASMHEKFMKNHVTVIGCPKLDAIDYSEKLEHIIAYNDIKSVTIVRMEVPCCGGLENAAKKALQASGKFIPWQVVVISMDGKILE